MLERLNPRIERASSVLPRMNPTLWVASALQADWGKCGEAWMVSYCAQSCKRCPCTSHGNTTSPAAPPPGFANSPAPTPPGAPAHAPSAPPPASAPSGPASQQQLLQPLFQQLGGAGQSTCQTDVLNFVR